MKKALIFLSALIFSTSTIADHHAPASQPGILEAWQCNYKLGKNHNDLMSARDYLRENAAVLVCPWRASAKLNSNFFRKHR